MTQRHRSTRLQVHPTTLMEENLRSLFPRRTSTQILLRKDLPHVQAPMLTLSSRMVSPFPALRIGLGRLARIPKSVVPIGPAITMLQQVLLHMTTTTSMTDQEGPRRKAEPAHLTLIPSQFVMAKTRHAYARQSPPCSHLLLYL
jgi:hypothetical protein